MLACSLGLRLLARSLEETSLRVENTQYCLLVGLVFTHRHQPPFSYHCTIHSLIATH